MQLADYEEYRIKSQSNIIIRPILACDKEKLFHLVKQRGTFNEKEIEIAIEVIEDTLTFPEKKEYYTFCALEDNGDIAGFICFGPIPMTDRCYDLYWIAVDEKFSRNGIGKKLLEAMENFVVKEKARRIYIDTSSTAPYTPARTFYENHGFRLVTVLLDFYRLGDDKIILMKELTSNEM
ncbi:MAG: GNAT family N-acetyltransferase [Thermodesulfobacteriota bacterium]|jgi:ribosomal protein S18 acetylase RimI-like enzyme|nr:MAG: GNAT family N-acetyltransferase [Thermodesulfobacteriota bacterium]